MQRTYDFLCLLHRPKQKKIVSVMFILGDGIDSCSLMQGALSMHFRDKEAETERLVNV